MAVAACSAGVLDGFDLIEVDVGGETLTVALADTADLQAQGLAGVDDLGRVDGMLFVFDGAAPVAFWMKETLIPLDLWFFDDTRTLVGAETMAPCPGDPCPQTASDGLVLFALETPAGAFDFQLGDALTVPSG